jgi:hypothetical protein
MEATQIMLPRHIVASAIMRSAAHTTGQSTDKKGGMICPWKTAPTKKLIQSNVLFYEEPLAGQAGALELLTEKFSQAIPTNSKSEKGTIVVKT